MRCCRTLQKQLDPQNWASSSLSSVVVAGNCGAKMLRKLLAGCRAGCVKGRPVVSIYRWRLDQVPGLSRAHTDITCDPRRCYRPLLVMVMVLPRRCHPRHGRSRRCSVSMISGSSAMCCTQQRTRLCTRTRLMFCF